MGQDELIWENEVLEMARQADVWVAGQEPYQSQLEAFAKLVASKEREACAKLMLDSQLGGIGVSIKAAYLIRARAQADR